MLRTPVESPCVVSIGYDEAKRVLEVEFPSGAVYQYMRVPAELVVRWMRAESKGIFFNAEVYGVFEYRKVFDPYSCPTCGRTHYERW